MQCILVLIHYSTRVWEVSLGIQSLGIVEPGIRYMRDYLETGKPSKGLGK